MRSRLTANVAANFLGRGFSSLFGLLLFPVYSAALGAESFGLVAFYLTFQSVVTFLDLGLNATVVRQTAYMHQHPAQPLVRVRELVATIEWWYWCGGLLIAALTLALSGLIAGHWLKADTLGADRLHLAVVLMGLSVSAQWPSLLYGSVMMGLQRQVTANLTVVSLGLLRWGGAAVALSVKPDIETFFGWQVFSSVVATFVSRLVLSGAYAGIAAQPVSWPLFRQLMRDLRPMMAITISATVLSQLDRIILSASAPLEVFGHYSMAMILASTLFLLAIPFQSATMPRFSGLNVRGAMLELEQLYAKVTQACAAVVMPAAATLVVFSHDLVLLWTGSPATTARVAPLLSILAFGSCLNATMYLPLGLQLACGITRTALWSNLLSVVIQAPLLIYLANYYQVHHVALSWAVFNIGYILIVPIFIHRDLLPKALNDWWARAVVIPLVLSFVLMLLAQQVADLAGTQASRLAVMVIFSALALLACVFSNPLLRKALFWKSS